MLAAAVFGVAVFEPMVRRNHVVLADRAIPLPPALRNFTFGHRRSLSAALWLKVLTWYGGGFIKDRKGFLSDSRDSNYLIRELDSVILLDPYFPDPYAFAALNLMWYANRPKEALRYLEAAMVRFPNDFRYPFYYGFIHMRFLNENGIASKFFYLASLLPESPTYMSLLAAKLQRQQFGTDEAIDTLEAMLAQPLPKELEPLLANELKVLKEIAGVEAAVAKYLLDHGKVPTLELLVAKGYIKQGPSVEVQIQSDGKVKSKIH